MCSNSFRFDASTAVRAVRFSNMALLATLDCSLGSVRRYFPGQFLRNSFIVEKVKCRWKLLHGTRNAGTPLMISDDETLRAPRLQPFILPATMLGPVNFRISVHERFEIQFAPSRMVPTQTPPGVERYSNRQTLGT